MNAGVFDPQLSRERGPDDRRLLVDHRVACHLYGTTRRRDVYRAGSYVEVLSEPFMTSMGEVVPCHVAGDFFYVPVGRLASSAPESPVKEAACSDQSDTLPPPFEEPTLEEQHLDEDRIARERGEVLRPIERLPCGCPIDSDCSGWHA